MSNKSLISLFSVLFLVSAAVGGFAQTVAPTREALPESLIALPLDSGIKTRWVLPPNPELADSVRRNSPARNGPEYAFSVDAAGNPWIGIDGQRLICPTKSFRAVLSEPWHGFTHLDNGGMLLSTVRHLGFIGIDKEVKVDKNGWPIVPFQPITALPGYYSRLYGGYGDSVYLVSGNASTGKSTLFLLQPETVSSASKNSSSAVSRYQKLLETEEPITAVAGDGVRTFVAFGRLVTCIESQDKSLIRWPTAPAEEIRDLAYHPDLGPIYATDRGIGYLGLHRHLPLLRTPNPRICLRNGTLYIFFPKTYGVLALDNIADISKSNRP